MNDTFPLKPAACLREEGIANCGEKDFCKAGLYIEFISSVSYDPFEDPDLSKGRSKYSFER